VVIAQFLQAPIAQQQVNDQQQHHHPVAEDRADPQMVETAPQAAFQVELGEQRVKHHQAGKGGQALVLESDLGKAVKFTMDESSAMLHANGLLLVDGVFVDFHFTNDWPFFMHETRASDLILRTFWNSPEVNSSCPAEMARNPCNDGDCRRP